MTIDTIIKCMAGTAWDVAYDCGLHEGMCDTIAATIASSEKAFNQAAEICGNANKQGVGLQIALRQVVKDVRKAHAGYKARQEAR